AMRRTSLRLPGPDPPEWLLKNTRAPLTESEAPSSSLYQSRISADLSFCVSLNSVISRSPTIRRYTYSAVTSVGLRRYSFSVHTIATFRSCWQAYTSSRNHDLGRHSSALRY